jgi:hypothetical protein
MVPLLPQTRKITVVRDLMPCNLIGYYHCFGVTRCFLLHGRRVIVRVILLLSFYFESGGNGLLCNNDNSLPGHMVSHPGSQ